MPVRILLRLSKFLCDAFLKTLRDEMLQALGFIVNFINGVIENFVQESLNQAVMATISRARFCPARERRTP